MDGIEEVYTYLASEAMRGNLGLFLGAGFSKAVCSKAKSWKDLIDEIAKEFDANVKHDDGETFPEFISKIIEKLSTPAKDGISITEKIKKLVCQNTFWLPHENGEYKEIRNLLLGMNPKWIITTNYDLIIETILFGKCISLNPDKFIVNDRNKIPIFHLHGCRGSAESIVICEEDYIKIFRPGNFSQLKLATLLAESTVLFLGYKLKDPNVLIACDWAHNVFKNTNPKSTIQFIYDKNSMKYSSEEKNDKIIITGNCLKKLLHSINEKKHVQEEDQKRKTQEKIDSFESIKKRKNEILNKCNDLNSIKDDFSSILHHLKYFVDSGLYEQTDESINLIKEILIKFEENANISYNFEAYKKWLEFIFEQFLSFDSSEIINTPLLFKIFCDSFNRIVPRIGKQLGQGWSAHDFWVNHREKLNTIYEELKSYAVSNGKDDMLEKIKEIENTTANKAVYSGPQKLDR